MLLIKYKANISKYWLKIFVKESSETGVHLL